VDRLVLKTMPLGSPKAEISGGNAAYLSQRVEDNAFHLITSGNNPALLLAARFHGGDFSEIGREFIGGERLDIHFD
jgi:hypothetical protein